MPELLDSSVWARRRHPLLSAWFAGQLRANAIAICDQVRIELLHSARTLVEFRTLRAGLDVLPLAPINQAEWTRAVNVFESLASIRPQWHRSVRVSDFIIAAAAEAAGMVLVHYDKDFDAIGAVTRQPMRWVAAQGTL